MAKQTSTILVQETEIRFYEEKDGDFISLTDIAKKFNERSGQLIMNWVGMTAKQWKEVNPTLKGNMRDYATAEQLLVLVNLENLNAHFIKEKTNQADRLQKLNQVAIYQMELFEGTTSLKLL